MGFEALGSRPGDAATLAGRFSAEHSWLYGLAQQIFDEVRRETLSREGVTRASWGTGESTAAAILRRYARSFDIESRDDNVGNLYVVLPGADSEKRKWITGSHLDSVPEGGNFDGLAGVIAGLLAVALFRRTGYVPQRDVSVIGFRGEEASSWFTGSHRSHLGSRAMLGTLTERELNEAIHRGSGLSFRRHLEQLGFAAPTVGESADDVRPDTVHGFVELHIEQGPVLESKGLPVGIVSAIRGSLRARNCRALGEYGHSGAVPHDMRKDAVFAAADFAGRCEQLADRMRSAGGDLDITLGQFGTDQSAHSLSKVAGEVRFTLDARSASTTILDRCQREIRQIAADVSAARGVQIDLGDFVKSEPATMDPALSSLIEDKTKEIGVPFMTLSSGAGHDASEFAHCGIPAGMIFIRNANGSHNPSEQMEIADFVTGVRVLAATLAS